MTKAQARACIVDALHDGWTGGGEDTLALFHRHGLATDDDTTTWGDVFDAADMFGWAVVAQNAADRSAKAGAR